MGKLPESPDAKNPVAPAVPSQDELRVAYEALDRAIELLPAAADRASWAAGLGAAARDIFAVIEQHRALFDDEHGPLADLAVLKPGLINSIQRRQREHLEMLHRAREIDVTAERATAFDDFNVDLLVLEARILRDVLRLHLLRANALVYEAYFRDEGGEDG